MSSVFGVVAVVYLLAGLVAWWLRPFSRMGVITAVGGVALFPVGWFATTNAPLAATGTVVSEFPLPVMTSLLLAFPSGRLKRLFAVECGVIGAGGLDAAAAHVLYAADGSVTCQ